MIAWSLIGFAFLLLVLTASTLPAWRLLWFRYAAITVARHRRIAAGLGLIAVMLGLIRFARTDTGQLLYKKIAGLSWTAAGTWAGVVLLMAFAAKLYRMRGAVYIAEFHCYGGDDKLKQMAAGGATMLANEIGRIRDLYDSLGNSADSVINVSLSDLSADLKNIVDGTKITVLGVSVNIAALTAWLMPRAWLSGSFHDVGAGEPVLLASFEGGTHGGKSWRVGAGDIEQIADSRPVGERLVEQLAYRVVTDRGIVGSQSWRAVRLFSKGIGGCRTADRSSAADRAIRLREAETFFLQAIAHDSKFWRCFYHLGFVYRDLHLEEASQTAFGKAINLNPEFGDAYYELASTVWRSATKNRFGEALSIREYQDFARIEQLCTEATRIDNANSRAWSMLGIAQRRFLPETPQYQLASRSHGNAVAMSCRRLAWRPGDLDRRRGAQFCLLNLAIAKASRDDAERTNELNDALRILEQAIWIGPRDANLFLEYGKILTAARRWEQAVSAFGTTLDLGGSIESLTKPPSDGTGSLLKQLVEALDQLGLSENNGLRTVYLAASDQQQDLDRWDVGSPKGKELSDIHSLCFKACEFQRRLEEILWPQQPGAASESADKQAQLAREIKAFVDQKDSGIAEPAQPKSLGPGHESAASSGPELAKELKRFIDKLDDRRPQSVDALRLHALLAVTIAREPAQLADARNVAIRGVERNPFDYWVRSALGDIHSQLKDFSRAREQWVRSMDLEPSDLTRALFSVNQTLITTNAKVGGRQGSKPNRDTLQAAIDLGEHLLKDVESRKWNRSNASDIAHVHYRLAMSYALQSDIDKAIAHLEICRASGEFGNALDPPMMLGVFLLRQKRHNEAAEVFTEGIKQCELELQPGVAVDRAEQVTGEKAQMLLGRATCYAERGANDDQAETDITAAEDLMKGIQNPEFQEFLHETKGCVAYSKGRWDLAIENLQLAINVRADRVAYYRLAASCVRKAEQTKDVERANSVRLARDSIRRARASDDTDWYEDEMKALEVDLTALAATIAKV